MNYCVAIDLPLLSMQSCIDWTLEQYEALYSCLDELKGDQKVEVLFREELWNLICESTTDPYIIGSLSLLNHRIYDHTTFSKYVLHAPELTSEQFAPAVNIEILTQVCTLRELTKQTSPLYLVVHSRISGESELEIAKDGKTVNVSIVCLDNEGWKGFIRASQPQLVQHKHHATAGMRNGIIVSPFSALNQGLDYARSLLLQAYDEYQGTDAEPHYLYTWDRQNGVFVEFRKSRPQEYHAMDVTTKDIEAKIPEYIRQKYNK